MSISSLSSAFVTDNGCFPRVFHLPTSKDNQSFKVLKRHQILVATVFRCQIHQSLCHYGNLQSAVPRRQSLILWTRCCDSQRRCNHSASWTSDAELGAHPGTWPPSCRAQQLRVGSFSLVRSSADLQLSQKLSCGCCPLSLLLSIPSEDQ
jgi:hypothetical protein